MEAHPDAYLKKIAEVFGCHPASVLKWLRKLGIARKKERVLQRASPQTRRGVLEKIKDIPKEKLVYIDETGIQTQMYRQYVRSKRGKG